MSSTIYIIKKLFKLYISYIFMFINIMHACISYQKPANEPILWQLVGIHETRHQYNCTTYFGCFDAEQRDGRPGPSPATKAISIFLLGCYIASIDHCMLSPLSFLLHMFKLCRSTFCIVMHDHWVSLHVGLLSFKKKFWYRSMIQLIIWL